MAWLFLNTVIIDFLSKIVHTFWKKDVQNKVVLLLIQIDNMTQITYPRIPNSTIEGVSSCSTEGVSYLVHTDSFIVMYYI